ncbi:MULTISPECIES: ABC transporter ATP-binding protein [Calothrix]|uniref:ABC transporter ATP-binding protein n=2 Tax=Calothrix TaxID=1186 RepID=A0ABR8AJ59_9CYAN|nr:MULTISPECIES: ABC transporter ATP-binding protein [Calothrix]MBD2200090.1 ABC transporter ATP-binding protein [Calothrix parietina FACHB-288]MBD2229063.1 ABC transporter ATP-binding protein [Calothrix anomala FACHB-343]
MNHPPAIKLSHISKIYANGTVALKDLNLAIPEAQFVSLVGSSGCGKSTVLRLIAGLGQMSSGTIDWGLPAQARKLAFVFQDAALMPWANVKENVRLPLKLAKVAVKDAESLVEKTLALVGLEKCQHSYPRELSGGMKMRVSIARALVTQPNILLMDEPFGALDEITRSKLNSDLLDLWDQQRWTVVFVTHNIYEAVYLSNRVLVMGTNPGRVVADIEIAAPYPRNDSFRTSSVYMEYCREVSQALAIAMDYSNSI